MESKEIVIIILVVIAAITLIVLGFWKPEEPLTEFQEDLIYWGVEKEMAKNIELYFNGEIEYLTWDEMKAITTVYNTILENEETIEITNTAGIKAVVEDLNSVIGEITP